MEENSVQANWSALPGCCSCLVVGQRLWLHPLRAAYWESARVLLLADLHLGKAAHFRRAGIAAPGAIEDANMDRLISLLLDFKPRRVLILGDLFHSDYNPVWESFAALVRQFHAIRFELVIGNHDIMEAEHYLRAGLHLYPLEYREGPFLFSHHPLSEFPGDCYNLAGHLHPGVLLRGPGRQRLRFPCFHFGRRAGVLPAFGTFTGLAIQKPEVADQCFIIAEDKVLRVG